MKSIARLVPPFLVRTGISPTGKKLAEKRGQRRSQIPICPPTPFRSFCTISQNYLLVARAVSSGLLRVGWVSGPQDTKPGSFGHTGVPGVPRVPGVYQIETSGVQIASKDVPKVVFAGPGTIFGHVSSETPSRHFVMILYVIVL